jgi:3-oxoacyl-[acyl-carrier protein] reductase
VADEQSVKDFIETVVSQGGRLDGLVNNAGITRDGLIMRMSTKDWTDVLETNLSGVFYACRAAARPMMSQRVGRIVNIGSIVGLQGNAGQVNYSSAKAGLVGLTKSLARELASRNISVNCVAPGYVETDMTAKLTDEQKEAFFGNIPLKRGAAPEEIAAVVSFFLAEESAYVTGQVLNVCGGLAM